MKRLKILILLFFLAISIPLAFVLWQTYAGLEQEESGQLAFFSETLFDQIERELSALVEEEENRAVDEYQYFLAQPPEYQQAPQQLSPLSAMVYQDYILGYLQNNPDGSFQTPIIADRALIPEDRKALVQQLTEANRIFNSKKYNLPRLSSPETSTGEAVPAEAKKEGTVSTSFAERYLSRSKTAADKTYLGSKQQRVEEITPEQVLNIARENESFSRLDNTAGSAARRLPAPKPSAPGSGKDLTASLAEATSTDAEEKEQDGVQVSSMAASRPLPFQVELAPFQSVAIRADQIYIFRRIAINNQIYRQGFILLARPFSEYLLNTHFSKQPLAEFTTIKLQRRDKELSTIAEAGVSGTNASFVAERVFPSPFDFLSVTLSATQIPPSPARSSLHVAVAVLGVFMFLGLLAIYQSTRTIVAMSERRSQFVSSVTHELKTPLTNIRMYIEMLEQGIAPTPERQQEYLAIVNAESARLSGLINNVLELARLEKKQHHVHMQPGRLADLLAEVKTIMGQKLKQEGFTLEIQTPDITLPYDREVLIQILINLIENSIKFGRHSTTKHIRFLVSVDGKNARIAVSDSGPGIPQRSIAKVFDDFYRVDNDLTRRTGGTGIGLALVKKCITAMGGRVQAANNDGPGCTFTLFLPL